MSTGRRAEDEAAAALRRAEVVAPPVDVERIASLYGADVRFRGFEDETSGLLYSEGGRRIIVVNAAHHPNRQRFTVAHELGHLALHADQAGLFVDHNLVMFRKQAEGFDPREYEANLFASALLMPEEMLRRATEHRIIDAFDDHAVKALAHRFQVSAQALIIRLSRLGLIEGLSGQ